MAYMLLGLTLILGGIVSFFLWSLFWRGTQLSDVPLLLDFVMKYSLRHATLISPDEAKWIGFAPYDKAGQNGIRVLVPCSTLDDKSIQKLTAALGRGKRPYSFDHRRILYADFGARIDPIHHFCRTVFLDVFRLPEKTRFRYRPGGPP